MLEPPGIVAVGSACPASSLAMMFVFVLLEIFLLHVISIMVVVALVPAELMAEILLLLLR